MNTTREHLKSMFTETAEKVVKEEVEKHFDSAEDFVDFLQMTLIPDLRASGTIETAKDFEKGVNLITSGTRDDEFIAFLQNTLIPDLRASGIIHTAEDFEEMVEWMKDIEKKVYPDGGSPDDASGSQSSLQDKIDDFLDHYEGAIGVDAAGVEVFKKAKESDDLVTALQLFNDAGYDDFDEFILGNIGQ